MVGEGERKWEVGVGACGEVGEVRTQAEAGHTRDRIGEMDRLLDGLFWAKLEDDGFRSTRSLP